MNRIQIQDSGSSVCYIPVVSDVTTDGSSEGGPPLLTIGPPPEVGGPLQGSRLGTGGDIETAPLLLRSPGAEAPDRDDEVPAPLLVWSMRTGGGGVLLSSSSVS